MEFILAIAALTGAFWVAVVFFRGGLVGGALAVLLAGSCFGHPFFNLPVGPLPLTSDRVLLVLLVAQYILYRRWGWADPKPLARADYLLAAFLIVLVASTLTHDFRYHNAQPLSQLVFFYLMPATMYWIVRQARWSAAAVRWLTGSLVAFGVYLCLTAVAETHDLWALVFPTYIGSSEYCEFLGRGRGPFLNPAANGMVQSLGLCAALVSWPRLGRAGRAVVVLLLPIFAWGIYCTYTRSAWMGAALGVVIAVAAITPPRLRFAALASMLLGGVLVLGATWQNVLAFKRDRDVSAEDTAESAKLRPILAVVAWHMFLDRPLLGCGFGQYVQESPAYLSDRSTDFPLEKARPYVQHNAFLALLTETGLVGAGLFLALLASWTHTAWRLARSKASTPSARQLGLLFLVLMGAYLPNAMFQDVSIIPGVNMLLFFFGGAVSALGFSLAGASSVERPRLWVPEREAAASAV